MKIAYPSLLWFARGKLGRVCLDLLLEFQTTEVRPWLA